MAGQARAPPTLAAAAAAGIPPPAQRRLLALAVGTAVTRQLQAAVRLRAPVRLLVLGRQPQAWEAPMPASLIMSCSGYRRIPHVLTEHTGSSALGIMLYEMMILMRTTSPVKRQKMIYMQGY